MQRLSECHEHVSVLNWWKDCSLSRADWGTAFLFPHVVGLIAHGEHPGFLRPGSTTDRPYDLSG